MTMKDWPRRMGETPRRRTRATILAEQKALDREHQEHAACLRRWPAIVAAMRTVVAGYNHGVGLKAVTLVEDTVNHGVTLESVANGRRALVMALDGSDVSVRTHNKNGDSTGRYWVSLNRTDENAAAYLLRDWTGDPGLARRSRA